MTRAKPAASSIDRFAALVCGTRTPRWLCAFAVVERGSGWAIAPHAAYGFSVVWHSVTLAEAVAELRRQGFDDVEVWASDGRRIAIGTSDDSTPWFHLLARAPRLPVD
jgi:hypothetical protein